jgi:hypothetical protein
VERARWARVAGCRPSPESTFQNPRGSLRRYSTQLGIDVDHDEKEIERWALAATLFGARISAGIAQRTFAALDGAGVHTIAQAGRCELARLIELLDARVHASPGRRADHCRSAMSIGRR